MKRDALIERGVQPFPGHGPLKRTTPPRAAGQSLAGFCELAGAHR